MFTDEQLVRTRTLQGRTGLQDWANHMTCLRVVGSAAEVTARLERLVTTAPVAPRAYQAVLSPTWGVPGIVTVRCESTQSLGPVTISRPVQGPTAEASVVWLEASPLICGPETLYEISMSLLAALQTQEPSLSDQVRQL